MVQTFDLKNKVVLLTGGYGHLGKAIAEGLLYHHATLYVLGRNEAKFSDAFKDMEVDKSKLHFVACDISLSENLNVAFQYVFDKEGQIDVVINNAFYSKGQSPETMTNDEWNYCLDGTLSSVFRSIKAIIPFYKKAQKGKIINVSSMYGMVAPEFDIYDDFPQFLNPPHYGAAKAGVIQLTKYYASYLGQYGVQVNTVTPGPFPSDAVQQSTGFVNALASKTCLNRIGKPEDLAGSFVFLASNTSNFITGQNIVIDGGWTIK